MGRAAANTQSGNQSGARTINHQSHLSTLAGIIARPVAASMVCAHEFVLPGITNPNLKRHSAGAHVSDAAGAPPPARSAPARVRRPARARSSGAHLRAAGRTGTRAAAARSL